MLLLLFMLDVMEKTLLALAFLPLLHCRVLHAPTGTTALKVPIFHRCLAVFPHDDRSALAEDVPTLGSFR